MSTDLEDLKARVAARRKRAEEKALTPEEQEQRKREWEWCRRARRGDEGSKWRW